MKADEILTSLQEALGEHLTEGRIRTTTEGVRERTSSSVWANVDRERLHDAVAQVWGWGHSHLAVVSGSDQGETIELTYHLTHGWGTPDGETEIHLRTELPKDDPVIDTITDIIPVAVVTEREKEEMLNVDIRGLPDHRHIFLSEKFPGGIYPWRKDEQGIPDDMIRDFRDEGVHK